MPGAEQDGEYSDADAKEQGQAVLPVFPGKQVVRVPCHDLDTVGNRLDLQGEQGQQRQPHGDGNDCAYPGAAKAECQHVGQ